MQEQVELHANSLECRVDAEFRGLEFRKWSVCMGAGYACAFSEFYALYMNPLGLV